MLTQIEGFAWNRANVTCKGINLSYVLRSNFRRLDTRTSTSLAMCRLAQVTRLRLRVLRRAEAKLQHKLFLTDRRIMRSKMPPEHNYVLPLTCWRDAAELCALMKFAGWSSNFLPHETGCRFPNFVDSGFKVARAPTSLKQASWRRSRCQAAVRTRYLSTTVC